MFASAPPGDMMDRFSDVLQFSSHTAKLMVSEIKKRAINLSTGKFSMLGFDMYYTK